MKGIIEMGDYYGSRLVSPVLLETASAIYRSALSWLEWNLGFSAAV